MRGRSSRDDPEYGVRFGVLRPRLVTVGSGGPETARTGTTTRAARSSLHASPEAMPGTEARNRYRKTAKAERRKASAPWLGARRASPARQFLRLSALRRPSFG